VADIINLRAAKKAADRAKNRAQGDENAMKFGRSKAERALEAARAEKARRDIDSHRKE